MKSPLPTNAKKKYYQISQHRGEYDYLVFPVDEYEHALREVAHQMEDQEVDEKVTINVIELTDKEYQEIVDPSE